VLVAISIFPIPVYSCRLASRVAYWKIEMGEKLKWGKLKHRRFNFLSFRKKSQLMEN
jgi:hypothetical protein